MSHWSTSLIATTLLLWASTAAVDAGQVTIK